MKPERNIRIRWFCLQHNCEHMTTLTHSEAFTLASSLMRAGIGRTVLLEDEAAALTQELDEADAKVEHDEFMCRVNTLLARGIILPASILKDND